MFDAIVGTKQCVWEKQTKLGLWDQVILVNANKDKTGIKLVKFEYHGF